MDEANPVSEGGLAIPYGVNVQVFTTSLPKLAFHSGLMIPAARCTIVNRPLEGDEVSDSRIGPSVGKPVGVYSPVDASEHKVDPCLCKSSVQGIDLVNELFLPDNTASAVAIWRGKEITHATFPLPGLRSAEIT